VNSLIEEAYAQQDWDDTTARQQRDQRVEELQGQGYHCTCITLYRVNDGMPVYWFSAELPSRLEQTSERPSKPPVSKGKPRRRVSSTEPRRVPQFEVR
jgi:hypothetical protein